MESQVFSDDLNSSNPLILLDVYLYNRLLPLILLEGYDSLFATKVCLATKATVGCLAGKNFPFGLCQCIIRTPQRGLETGKEKKGRSYMEDCSNLIHIKLRQF